MKPNIERDKLLLDNIFGSDSYGKTEQERAKTSKQLFVCGEHQLAFANKHATGLRITAREALELFGFEKLAEIVDYGSAILPPKSIEDRQLDLNKINTFTFTGILDRYVRHMLHIADEELEVTVRVSKRSWCSVGLGEYINVDGVEWQLVRSKSVEVLDGYDRAYNLTFRKET